RSDLWAFGCVLYEMLTGRRAFEGEDVSDTLAAILRGEPDWTALPPTVPDPVRLLVRRCLEKDRRKRVGDIAVARFLLTEPLAPAPAATAAPTTTAHASWRRAMPWMAAGLLSGAALSSLSAWAIARRTPPSAPRVARFTLVPSSATPFLPNNVDRNLAISPDGR